MPSQDTQSTRGETHPQDPQPDKSATASDEKLRQGIADILDVFGHQVINKEFGGDRVVLKREPLRQSESRAQISFSARGGRSR